ncbi:MAG TPA: type II secretion system protein [Albitalea sp.]|uniref:type II secretion system protein n=1 Tax=Piscinibacter sp. TaxID=1903157 RepID=UPI002ED61DE0
MDKGFTLIELLVVICIVAITTAVALPRFWQMQRQARIGHLNGVRGAVHAGATLVHAALLSRKGMADAVPCGHDAAADNRIEGSGTVCTEHGLVQTTNGYPASVTPGTKSLPGILGAAGIGTVFNPTPEQLQAEGYAVSVSAGTTTIARADATSPAQCSFTYTEPMAARTAATISPSVITGC